MNVEMPKSFLPLETGPLALEKQPHLPIRRDEPMALPEREWFRVPERGARSESVLDDAEVRERRLRNAAEGFEALFYAQMIKTMRKSVSESGLFGSGAGKDVYEGMFDDMLSKELARNGSLGVADLFLEGVRRATGRPERVDVSAETDAESEKEDRAKL